MKLKGNASVFSLSFFLERVKAPYIYIYLYIMSMLLSDKFGRPQDLKRNSVPQAEGKKKQTSARSHMKGSAITKI